MTVFQTTFKQDNFMKRLFLSVAIVFALALAAPAQLTFTVNDLINLKRVADPQLSPDGRTVAFTIGVVNKEANRTLTQIFVMSADGGGQKQLTNGSSSSSGPRWSPDGAYIVFNSGRIAEEGFGIYRMAPDGSRPRRPSSRSRARGHPRRPRASPPARGSRRTRRTAWSRRRPPSCARSTASAPAS